MPTSRTYSHLKSVPYQLIGSNTELDIALRSLEQSSILGLDCETTGLDPHTHTIRLIQIAAPNQPVILIDLPQITACNQSLLRQFLSSPTIKITHNTRCATKILQRKSHPRKLEIQPSSLGETNVFY